MQPLHALASPTFGWITSRCLATVAIAAAATLLGEPARAAVDDSWAGPMISQMMSQKAEEGGGRGRSRSTHRRTQGLQGEAAPPARNAPTRHKSLARHRGGGRLASLGRDMRPSNLKPLSVIEWARPNFSVTIPKAGSDPEGVGPMLASLGRDFFAPSPPSAPSLTGDAINWLPTALTDCLAAPLRGVLFELAGAFGPITVRWTCRSKQVNTRVGGAKRSYHLTGDAVDFNVTGNYRAILAFLKAKKEVGGLKHYGSGAFHIDTGPRRTW
jgi:hypothetical protein